MVLSPASEALARTGDATHATTAEVAGEAPFARGLINPCHCLQSAAVLQNLPPTSAPTFANTTAGGYLPEYTLKRAMEEAFVAMLL